MTREEDHRRIAALKGPEPAAWRSRYETMHRLLGRLGPGWYPTTRRQMIHAVRSTVTDEAGPATPYGAPF